MHATMAATLLPRLREAAGLSQRQLAALAGTSQPAIARYETGASTPSWSTLVRLAAACGHDLELTATPRADPEHVRLVRQLLELTPLERLRTLANWAALRTTAA